MMRKRLLLFTAMFVPLGVIGSSSSSFTGVANIAAFSQKTHSRLLFTAGLNFIGFVDNGAVHWVHPAADPQVKDPHFNRTGIAEPVLSPDGEKIAYQKVGADGTFKVSGLCIYSIAGRSEECPPEMRQAGAVAWAPDGNKLAYILNSSVRIYSPDEQKTDEFRDANYKPDGIYSRWVHSILSWSPDGRYIAYESRKEIPLKRAGESTQRNVIFVFDLHERKLSYVGEGSRPSWRGEHDLVYARDRQEVWTSDPDGDHKRILLKTPRESTFWRFKPEYPLIWSSHQEELILQEDIGEDEGVRVVLYDLKTGHSSRMFEDGIVINGWH